jgi:hypothetical protein
VNYHRALQVGNPTFTRRREEKVHDPSGSDRIGGAGERAPHHEHDWEPFIFSNNS